MKIALVVALAAAAVVSAPMAAPASTEVDPCVSASAELERARVATPGFDSSVEYGVAADEFAACAYTFPDTGSKVSDARACDAKLSAADAYVQSVIEFSKAPLPIPVPVTLKLDKYLRALDLFRAVEFSCEGANVETAKRGETTMQADLKALDLRQAYF